MIKLGNVIVNEEFVQAIEPWQEDGVEHGCRVLLRSGREILAADVFMAEVCQTLENAGVLAPTGPSFQPPQRVFSEAERAELRQAAMDGYCYAAKDKTGIVYVFRERPEKHGAYWGRADGTSDSRRLKLDYEALSFEDADALSLLDVFGWVMDQ